MDWNAIGAIGEIAGAIGVIVTLVYLAGQLKQNTRALRSSAFQNYNERTDSYWDFEAQHAAVLGAIYERQSAFEELTGEQKLILNASMMKAFNVLEGMFLQNRAGILGDREYLAKVEGFKISMRNALVRDAWQRLNPTMAFTQEFRTFMDTEVFNTSEFDNDSYYERYRK